MAGTKAGAQKARQTIYKKYGKDFYQNIGREGGKKGTTGGFASNKRGADGLTGYERAKVAGANGGRKSRRVGSYIYTATSAEGEKLSGSRMTLAETLGCSADQVYLAYRKHKQIAGYKINREVRKCLEKLRSRNYPYGCGAFSR